MALNVINYQTVTPTRVVDEANNTRVPIAPIDVHVYLHAPQVAGVTAGHGVPPDSSKRWMQTGLIRVRQGADLRDGDEIPLPEGTFGVVGGPQMIRPNILTGNTFGWVRYAIRKGG